MIQHHIRRFPLFSFHIQRVHEGCSALETVYDIVSDLDEEVVEGRAVQQRLQDLNGTNIDRMNISLILPLNFIAGLVLEALKGRTAFMKHMLPLLTRPLGWIRAEA